MGNLSIKRTHPSKSLKNYTFVPWPFLIRSYVAVGLMKYGTFGSMIRFHILLFISFSPILRSITVSNPRTTCGNVPNVKLKFHRKSRDDGDCHSLIMLFTLISRIYLCIMRHAKVKSWEFKWWCCKYIRACADCGSSFLLLSLLQRFTDDKN